MQYTGHTPLCIRKISVCPSSLSHYARVHTHASTMSYNGSIVFSHFTINDQPNHSNFESSPYIRVRNNCDETND